MSDIASIARSSSGEPRDTREALIDSRQQLLYTKAAAKLISAADELSGASSTSAPEGARQ